jgi:hypothetical protein
MLVWVSKFFRYKVSFPQMVVHIRKFCMSIFVSYDQVTVKSCTKDRNPRPSAPLNHLYGHPY